MRYDAAHKQRSRDRILEAARSLFRVRGFDGASIDQVMKAAGLTRGAFYAHFDSKADLVEHVLAIEPGLVREVREAADLPKVREALLHYLDTSERENVATGCPLVAHPVDVLRGTPEQRDSYRARLTELIGGIDTALGHATPSDEATHIALLCVAGGLLRSAVGPSDMADRIERLCRHAVSDALTAL